MKGFIDHFLKIEDYLFDLCYSSGTSFAGLEVDYAEFAVDDSCAQLFLGLIPTNFYIVYKKGFLLLFF